MSSLSKELANKSYVCERCDGKNVTSLTFKDVFTSNANSSPFSAQEGKNTQKKMYFSYFHYVFLISFNNKRKHQQKKEKIVHVFIFLFYAAHLCPIIFCPTSNI